MAKSSKTAAIASTTSTASTTVRKKPAVTIKSLQRDIQRLDNQRAKAQTRLDKMLAKAGIQA